jgi:hypothetical protein
MSAIGSVIDIRDSCDSLSVVSRNYQLAFVTPGM